MRQLPVVSHQNDPSRCQAHRNEQIKGICASRLVHNDILELEVVRKHLGHSVADGLLAGCGQNDSVSLNGLTQSVWVVLDVADELFQHHIRPLINTVSESSLDGGDHFIQHADYFRIHKWCPCWRSPRLKQIQKAIFK